ncbi:MAG: hypothetical protein ABWK05_03505 [Pyrobaculum sp.]
MFSGGPKIFEKLGELSVVWALAEFAVEGRGWGGVRRAPRVAKTHAEFNELLARYTAEGYTPKEAKLEPNGRAWYFYLYRQDLRELGVADLGQPGAA